MEELNQDRVGCLITTETHITKNAQLLFVLPRVVLSHSGRWATEEWREHRTQKATNSGRYSSSRGRRNRGISRSIDRSVDSSIDLRFSGFILSIHFRLGLHKL